MLSGLLQEKAAEKFEFYVQKTCLLSSVVDLLFLKFLILSKQINNRKSVKI